MVSSGMSFGICFFAGDCSIFVALEEVSEEAGVGWMSTSAFGVTGDELFGGSVDATG